jgi:NADH dehydrogenase (ubiquinone) 1 alpha subcomplex subunit 5
MRRTFRLLASVKPARYLEAGQPTGLTGLVTAASPRSTLLFLYHSTLEKLRAVPEHSLYRQSVEALTKHRLALVQATKPEGYDAWAQKTDAVLKDLKSERFRIKAGPHWSGVAGKVVKRDGKMFLFREEPSDVDPRYQEWDGEPDVGGAMEGSRTKEEREAEWKAEQEKIDEWSREKVELDEEPKLTKEQ